METRVSPAGIEVGSIRGSDACKELRRRKQVEQDAAVLRNRILQLERQEQRADIRIEKTKQRAREVIEQREHNEQRELERKQALLQLQSDAEHHQQNAARIREDTKRNRVVNEARLFQQKIALVQEVRSESREIEKLIAAQRLHEKRQALERKDEVKNTIESVSNAKQKEEERKRDIAKDTYVERLQRETDARQQKEQELLRLTKLERELIERLTRRQKEQDQAYEQLQSVLATGKPCVEEPAAQRPAKEAQQPRQPRSAHKEGRKGKQEQSNDAPPQAEDQSIRDVFHCVAKEHGTPGTIPASEVGTVLQMLGVQLDVSQQYEAVKQLDSKGTGKIAMQDFLSWVKG